MKTAYTFTVVVQHDGEPSADLCRQAGLILRHSSAVWLQVTDVEPIGQNTAAALCPHGHDTNAGCFACAAFRKEIPL